MRNLVIVLVILLFATAIGVAVAQDSPQVTSAGPQVSLSAQDMKLDQAVADLSKQAGVQIVCDTDVKGAVSGQFTSIGLEKLLDLIVKTNNLKWQKFYLPVPEDQKKPTLEQIKSRAAAIAAVTSGTMVVYDPTTGKQRVFVEQDSTAPKVEPDKLGLKPVYLISAPKVATKEVEAKPDSAQMTDMKFQSVQDQRMDLLSQMTSEQRVTAFQQEMESMINMDPATRKQIMTDQMKARREMSPEMRDQFRQMMREMGGGRGGRGQRGGGDGGNARQ